MAEIYDQAEQFKADLVRRERIAASQLVRQYGRSWKRLRALLTDVTDRIETARRQGIEVSPAWLYQQQRYQALIAQVEREVLRYVEAVDSSVRREQAAAIRAATRHAATAIRTAAASTPFASVTVTALPVEAITSMVGFLADGSPLSSLLAKLPPGMSREVGDALTEAVTLGYNPRKTAAIIRHRAGMTLSRSLTIARTETLRAYREATHQTYKANSNIVAGWYWVASLSRRTCAACIALHGTFHTMEERMSTHVRCRCTSIPGIKGDPSPFTENGEEWFAKQSAEVQRAVFSNNAAYQAYRDGQAKLTDFVGKQVNPVWGDSYVQLGAKRALAGEGRFRDMIDRSLARHCRQP
jgi:SPP1 gp7 family putative phage head morphogenesis protein